MYGGRRKFSRHCSENCFRERKNTGKDPQAEIERSGVHARKDEKMRYRIRLDTMSDVNNFVRMASKNPGKITLTDGENFTVNGKSLLGAMYTMEWNQVFCESENEIYRLIKDYIVDDSDPHEEE